MRKTAVWVLAVLLLSALSCASDPGRHRASVPDQMTAEDKVEWGVETGLMFFLSTLGSML